MGVFYCETKTRAIFKKKRKKYGYKMMGDEQAFSMRKNNQSTTQPWLFLFSLSKVSLICFSVEVGGEFHAWKQNIEKGRKDRQQVHSIENHSVWDLDGQDQLGLLGIPRNEDFSRYYINNQQHSDCTAQQHQTLLYPLFCLCYISSYKWRVRVSPTVTLLLFLKLPLFIFYPFHIICKCSYNFFLLII